MKSVNTVCLWHYQKTLICLFEPLDVAITTGSTSLNIRLGQDYLFN